MKRVLREAKRPGDPWDDQASYEADIAAADAELARDLGDPLSDAFARELATPVGVDDEMARGASLWGQSAPEPKTAPTAGPTIDDKPVAPGWVDIPNPWARTESNPTAPKPGRTEAFPREVREAYAVLELPLGADRSRIDQAFRALIQRYHPDLHAGQPDLQKTATELTIKLRDARELLFAWLEGRR